jgi:hypothetical protein
VAGAERADDGGSSIAGEPLVDVGSSLAGVAAWRELRGGAGSVAIRERRADGVLESAALSAPGGGTIGSLALGGSGLGDAIVAWRQGSGAKAQVAAAVIDAPPDRFLVEVPDGWQRKATMRVKWNAAENAVGGLRYSVSVDDEPIGKKTTRLHAVLKSKRVGEGHHRLQVFAIDDSGQATGSRKAALLVDRKPPRIALRKRGGRLAVLVVDRVSGVRGRTVKVDFGDRGAGQSAGASRRHGGRKKVRPVVIRHAYATAGNYRVTVTARDRAGNKTSFSRAVRVG